MRLIDADEYKDYIIDSLEGYKLLTNEYRDFARDIIRGFLKDIDAQPTAYDIDEIIERLEKLEKEHPYKVIGQPNTYSQYNEGWQDCIDRAIGVVKKGAK